MEKLIELLNEYVEKWNKSDLYYTFGLDSGWLFCYDDVTDHKGWTMQDEAMVVCSKKFGFIKWLVKKDKIDFSKFEYMINIKANKRELYYTKAGFHTEALLMLLSIQDEPIRFLISILK